jgi:mRNA-degrading endonuclease toxin of MazEF toxin-antitoxin module
MNFKDPKNILEFIKFQKQLLYRYKNYVKELMQKDYKKAAILAYWLRDYLGYIKNENTFKPKQLITYKRGQIVFVNFGFRVGQELGGLHYAIVLDVKNSKNTSTLTVIPLRSKKDKNTSYQNLYMVPLGGVLSDLIDDKAKAMVKTLNQEADDLAKKYPIDVIRTDKSLQSRVIKLRKQHKDAMAVLSYLDNLKSESMADIGQITTISKQRIKAPVRTTDVLTNIILPDELLNNLETKLKFLYFSCENP